MRSLIFTLYVFLLSAGKVFAAPSDDIITDPWTGCLSDDGVATLRCIPIVMQNIIYFLIGFASIVCVFIIILAGYKFVTSEGDPEKIANARKTALYALGGFILIIASFLIMNILGTFTGVERISPQN
jgi:hypothetical protein